MLSATLSADIAKNYRLWIEATSANVQASRQKIDTLADNTAKAVEGERARIEKIAPPAEGAWSIAMKYAPVDGRRINFKV